MIPHATHIWTLYNFLILKFYSHLSGKYRFGQFMAFHKHRTKQSLFPTLCLNRNLRVMSTFLEDFPEIASVSTEELCRYLNQAMVVMVY